MDTGVACYCYGDSTCGQRVFYQFGMTQIPIYNVNNNCSTGSTGLHLGRTMISVVWLMQYWLLVSKRCSLAA